MKQVKKPLNNIYLAYWCLPPGIVPPADFEEEEVTSDPSGETLTLEAKMQPLLLDSMTKSKDGFLGVSKGSLFFFF